MKKNIVENQELLSKKVGNWLLKKGFTPTSRSGLALNVLIDENGIGISKEEYDKEKNLLAIIFPWNKRDSLMGIIWFKNEARGADGKKWVLFLKKISQQEIARQLIGEMEDAFGIRISLQLY